MGTVGGLDKGNEWCWGDFARAKQYADFSLAICTHLAREFQISSHLDIICSSESSLQGDIVSTMILTQPDSCTAL